MASPRPGSHCQKPALWWDGLSQIHDCIGENKSSGLLSFSQRERESEREKGQEQEREGGTEFTSDVIHSAQNHIFSFWVYNFPGYSKTKKKCVHACACQGVCM